MMTETPTPDDLARWAALADSATPGPWGKLPSDHARGEWFVQFAPGGRDTTVMQANDAEFIAAAREALPRLLALVAARAELSALRATDEYQRWARAVTERDAARDAVARVAAVINDPARTWIIDTHNDDGTVEKRGREVVDSDDIRAALGAAT